MCLRIAYIVGTIEGGGAERATVNLANTICKEEDIILYLFTRHPTDNEYQLDKKVRRCCVLGNKLYKDILSVLHVIKKEKIDVLIGMGIYENICTCLIKILHPQIKIIISERNDPAHDRLSRKSRVLRYLLYPKADGIVFQTEEAKRFYEKRIHWKYEIIPNPITAEGLPQVFEGEERKKLIVSVGRMDLQKNQEMLIQAFAALGDEFSEYKLVIYGEGELRRKLKAIANDLAIEGRIVLPGFKTDVLFRIREASLFVLSSDYEGMPNALIEAMAVGLPCISTDCPCGGPRFLIDNGKNGLLIPVGDTKAMSRAITYMLHNPKQADIMGRRAAAVRTVLNANVIALRWIDFINTL